MGLLALTTIAYAATPSAGAGPGYPVAIDIQNAWARVGEKAVIVAKIRIGDGFAVTDSYGHRLSRLSASDGVELERGVVRGSVQDRSIVFAVVVTPKRVGTRRAFKTRILGCLVAWPAVVTEWILRLEKA